MPKDALYPDEPGLGFKPVDPTALKPTGINDQGVTSDEVAPASPADQKQYQKIQLMVGRMIHGPKAPRIIEQMNDPTRPVHEVVGDVVADLGRVVIKTMESSKDEPDLMAVLSAAEDYVIPELFEIGEAAGVLPEMTPEEEQKEMQLTLLHAQSKYGNQMVKEGRAPTQEARQVLDEQFQKEGKGYSLDQFLRDAGSGNEQNVRQPQGGPPSQLRPLAQAVQSNPGGPGLGAQPPGGDLFNG